LEVECRRVARDKTRLKIRGQPCARTVDTHATMRSLGEFLGPSNTFSVIIG
jgi:hypothetical protein